MKTMSLIFVSMISLNVWANELPAWIEKSAKLQSYEHFIDWMKNEKFYRIIKTESQEITIPSKPPVQQTEIFFEDVSGCKNRKQISICVPFGLDTGKPTLTCQNLVSDCLDQ